MSQCSSPFSKGIIGDSAKKHYLWSPEKSPLTPLYERGEQVDHFFKIIQQLLDRYSLCQSSVTDEGVLFLPHTVGEVTNTLPSNRLNALP